MGNSEIIGNLTISKNGNFEIILTSGRVLSIQTNPYQALMILHKNWQIKTVERESENDTLELNNQKSWFLTFQLKMQSPWHLAKSPSHLTKCQNASNPNLDVDEKWTPPKLSLCTCTFGLKFLGLIPVKWVHTETTEWWNIWVIQVRSKWNEPF